MDVGIAPLSLPPSSARAKPIGDESRPPRREREREIERNTLREYSADQIQGSRLRFCLSKSIKLMRTERIEYGDSADPNFDADAEGEQAL